jgi:tetratricopeptide (TPR) repeat protein
MKSIILIVALTGFVAASAMAQQTTGPTRGNNILYGDVQIDGTNDAGFKPLSLDIILYSLNGQIVARQKVTNNGRYRFNDLNDGEYDLVVETEASEVARLRVMLRSPIFKNDYRQDINLALKGGTDAPAKASTVSAEDEYKRPAQNQKKFEKAQAATNEKKYDEGLTALKQIVADDPNDFQAWTEIGTVYLIKGDGAEAEKAYAKAIELRPKFFLALMNLGRLRMMEKNYDGAIPVLTDAVKVKPTSADANYYLGEAYLQVKKGSKAVDYLNEAIKLDPVGKAEAHLRLATLYNAVGLKDKAALEYEEFLKQKPDYADRKKLEQYIQANKGAAQSKKP